MVQFPYLSLCVCEGGKAMAPVRSYGNWHLRKSDQKPAVEPYCKYYFIAEGANTEKFYFEKLIDAAICFFKL